MQAQDQEKDAWHDLYRLAPCGLHSLDSNGRYLSVNDTELSWLGYSYQEVLGRKFTHFLTLQSIQIFEKNFPKFKKFGHVQNLEFDMIRKNGAILTVLLSATAVFDQNGHFLKTHSLMINITARRRLESGLLDSEQKFRGLFESIADGIGRVDLQGYFLECNQALLKMLSYELKELQLLTYQQITPECWHERDQNAFQQALSRGFSDEYEKEFIKKDGALIPVAIRAWLIQSKQGKPQGLWGIVRDITERKRTESALRESEARFRNAMENAPIGMAIVSLEGNFIQVNRAYAAILGYEKEELETLRFQEITHPDDLEFDLTHLRSLQAGKISFYRIEKRLYRKNGSIVWVQLTASTLRNPLGKALYYITQVEDISERKKAEEILLQNDLELREAQRVAQMGNWEWNQMTNKMQWSEQMYRIFGQDPKTPAPNFQTQSRLFTDDSFTKLNIATSECLKSGKPYALDLEIIRPNGTKAWIAIRGELKKNPSDELIGLRGTAQDITERKRLEQELARSNSDLEQYAYIVSHDLREPLRMIQSYSELLAIRYRGKLDSNADRYFKYILEGTGRMNHLIHDLLLYARAGRQDLIRENIDLNEILQTVLKALSKTIQDHQAQIILLTHLPVTFANRSLISQVFQNLISNAIKFHKKDLPPIIKISAKTNPENPSEWIYSVEDNGIGIETEYFKKVFMLFQRLHEQGIYPGTGIGLAICKRIIERHGGRIWFTSRIGQGTTFYFTLPPIYSCNQQAAA